MHTYELLADEKDHVLFEHRPVVVTAPHFHNAIEFMFVEKGQVSVSVGGDFALIHSLYDMLEGKSSSATALEASVESHLMGIAAEDSRKQNGVLISVH